MPRTPRRHAYPGSSSRVPSARRTTGREEAAVPRLTTPWRFLPENGNAPRPQACSHLRTAHLRSDEVFRYPERLANQRQEKAHCTILGCTTSTLPKRAPASSADGRTLTNSRIISEQPLVALPAEFLLRLRTGAATPTSPVRPMHRGNCPYSWASWRRVFSSGPARCRCVPSFRPWPNRPLGPGIGQVPRREMRARKSGVGRGLQQLPPGPSRDLHWHIGDDRQLTQLTSHHLQTIF